MMTPAALRIGSLEILAALAVFGALVSRVKPGAAPKPAPVSALLVNLTVHDTPARGGTRDAGVTVVSGKPAVIGRSSEAAVGILDPEVSRSHAALSLVDGVLYVADTGSVNGTFLNGKRVREDGIEVRAGDALDVGTTRITVNDISPA